MRSRDASLTFRNGKPMNEASNHHAVMELSIQLEQITAKLEKLGDRWLVLMEKEGG